MQSIIFIHMEVIKYRESFREQLINVWDRSVMGTHQFLQEEDYQAIKKLVKKLDFTQFETFCAVENGDMVIGFMAVKDRKLEMLFLEPAYIGRGIGASMMQYAKENLLVNEVDVNEQNIPALGFYKRMGFVPFSRSERDGLGKGYPIINMRLHS